MGKQVIIQYITGEELIKALIATKDHPELRPVFRFGVEVLPKYLNTQEAMDMIRCSRDHIRRLVERGVLKKVRMAVGELRYDRDEIIHAINEGLV